MHFKNVLSCFDGVSCGQLALIRAGHTYDNYYASEVDKYAIKTTLKNFPQTIQLGDIKSVWSRNLPQIDLIMGGSPCQDLSIAKAGRKGLDGERSCLFWHFVRLVRTCKPKYFLLENVASMPKESKEIISKALGVEPILINSALVSAQQRKRLYWTNIPGITQPQDKGLLLKDILEDGLPNEEKSRALTASYDGAVIWNSLARKQRTMIAKPILFSKYNQSSNWEKALALGTRCGDPTSKTGQYVVTPIKLGEFGRGGQGYRVYSVVGKRVSINGNSGGWGANTGPYKIDLPDGDYAFRKLSPVECERLQTLPDNYTEGVSDTQRYKCIGNGWTVDVIAHIFSFIWED